MKRKALLINAAIAGMAALVNQASPGDSPAGKPAPQRASAQKVCYGVAKEQKCKGENSCVTTAQSQKDSRKGSWVRLEKIPCAEVPAATNEQAAPSSAKAKGTTAR